MSSCHSFNDVTINNKNKGFKLQNLFNHKIKENYLLVGNPNVGKSTYFNKITWSNSPVGNIDRITVNLKKGTLRQNSIINIIDLPGVYSLLPTTKDEEIVINTILNKNYLGAINIIGASSFKRDMHLTIQLLEANILNEICINMIDELNDYNVSVFNLSRKLKVPVTLTSATKNIGVKASINQLINTSSNSNNLFKLKYTEDVEQLISNIEQILCDICTNLNTRFLAIQYLEGNYIIHNLLSNQNYKNKLDELLKSYDLNIIQKNIREIRNKYIEDLYNFAFIKKTNNKINHKNQFLNKVDKWLLNPWIGIISFILVIFVIYYLTFGNYAGGYINEQWTGLLEKIQELISNSMPSASNTQQWLQLFVSDGILGGIFTVLGFLPYIIIMFTLIYCIEQTGYLSRISLLLDNKLSKFGLSGRSIITLIAATGCNVPSIMMARNAHSFKERTIIILISPFISCSARLVVFIWISQQFITNNSYTWLIGIGFTILSGLVALLMGLIFSSTLFRSKNTFMLTEISKWRSINILVVLKKTLFEIIDFLKRVLTIVFIVNLIIFLLNYISPTLGLVVNPNELTNSSINLKNATFLQYISLVFQYIFYPIGIGQDYRLASSLIAAAPAKEIAASVLDSTFNVNNNTFYNVMFGPNSTIHLPIATIISYVLMFSFYTPCIATIVVLKKEGGYKNLIIHMISTFAVAYILSLFAFCGIGSIELLALKPHLINNALIIISWILFAIIFIYMIITNGHLWILKNKNKPIKYLQYKNVYMGNWIALFLCILTCILVLVFCFVYA